MAQQGPSSNVQNKIIINKYGFCIPTALLSIDDRMKIINDLTVEPERYIGRGKMYDIYTKTSSYTILPRYYGLVNFAKKAPIDNRLSTGVQSSFKITFSDFQLNKQQQGAFTEILKAFRDFSSATIKLECGSGKTVLGIYIANKLQTSTLVIVHRVSLLKQWANEVAKFTNAKVGMMHRKIDTHKGADITVTTIKYVLMRKDSELDIFKDFGLAIFDEAHHLNAQQFHLVLARVNCYYRLGLSATPNKGEKINISHVFKQFLSPIVTIEDPTPPIPANPHNPPETPDQTNEQDAEPLTQIDQTNSDDFVVGGSSDNLEPPPGPPSHPNPDNEPVSNKMVVLKNNGNTVKVLVVRYAKQNGDLTKHLDYDFGVASNTAKS
jgi:hypothetical protein